MGRTFLCELSLSKTTPTLEQMAKRQHEEQAAQGDAIVSSKRTKIEKDRVSKRKELDSGYVSENQQQGSNVDGTERHKLSKEERKNLKRARKEQEKLGLIPNENGKDTTGNDESDTLSKAERKALKQARKALKRR